MNDCFTFELVQAVNDWQRGGDHDQKVKRGRRLKACASDLPAKFRTCHQACYRQEAHESDRTWALLIDNCLPETIASWTTSLQVAKHLKGGVPPPGFQGIIFSLTPPETSVVLNLISLYEDRGFQAAIEAHKSRVVGFGDGIGRWESSQREVVLELENLETAAIYSYGGFPGDSVELARLFFKREPSQADVAEFERLRAAIPVETKEWWLSPEGTQDVIGRVYDRLYQLRDQRRSERSLA